MDLALNNLEWLMCHKTKPNQTNQNNLTARIDSRMYNVRKELGR